MQDFSLQITDAVAVPGAEDLRLGKTGGELFDQRIADRILGLEVARVDQIQAQHRRVAELVVFEIRGDEGIAACRGYGIHKARAGPAAYGHPPHGSAALGIAQAGTGKDLPNEGGKGGKRRLFELPDADQTGGLAVRQDLDVP